MRYGLAIASAALLLGGIQVPAFALSGVGGGAGSGRCDAGSARQRGSSLLGGMLGGLASSALGRAGVPSSVVGVSLPISSVLTDVIMSKLDCKEQQKAATATTEAVRGGVGASSTWKSDTRAGVSGSSTVTGQQTRADGATCLTVTDIVIVNGEETRAPKKMCRSPGGGNYVVAV